MQGEDLAISCFYNPSTLTIDLWLDRRYNRSVDRNSASLIIKKKRVGYGRKKKSKYKSWY